MLQMTNTKQVGIDLRWAFYTDSTKLITESLVVSLSHTRVTLSTQVDYAFTSVSRKCTAQPRKSSCCIRMSAYPSVSDCPVCGRMWAVAGARWADDALMPLSMVTIVRSPLPMPKKYQSVPW